MKAIILAAGMGNRLKPFTSNIPKGMVKLGGKSLLEIQIDIFKKLGITDISIVRGYLPEKITFPSINYFYNENYSTTAGNVSLFCAKEKLQDSVIITYSDIVFDESIIRQMINFSGDFGIAVDLDWEKNYVDRDQHPKNEADNILFDKEGKIIAFQKNLQKPHSTIGEFLGIVKLSKKGSLIFSKKLSELYISHKGKFHGSSSFAQSIMPDMLQELIDSGYDIEPLFFEGKWCEIDTPQDLERAKKFFC